MTGPGQTCSERAAEQAARESFGRLVSWLAWQWRDIAAAEDALADALVKALQVWPAQGVPASPDAWLITVARRQLLQIARHDKVRFDPAVTTLLAQQQVADESASSIPDARLRLMFVCAHPAIDATVRLPLMLQVVLGLHARQIAPAMLMTASALSQRLVRAKKKIRATQLSFDEPPPDELPERCQDVLESIYGAFGLSLGPDSPDQSPQQATDLREEAVYLCQVVCQLLPELPEAKGLLALMMFCLARREGQRGPNGEFIALADQDVSRWNRTMIVRADELLVQAAQMRQPGLFQTEAAIQSAHCQRLFTGQTPWSAIAHLYQRINAHYPSAGSRVAGAVAMAESGHVGDALEMLDKMPASQQVRFQSWWVARAHLLEMNGQLAEAINARVRAIELTGPSPAQAYLQGLNERLKTRIES